MLAVKERTQNKPLMLQIVSYKQTQQLNNFNSLRIGYLESHFSPFRNTSLRASLVDDSVTTLLATNRLVRFHLHNLAAVYDSSGAESTTSTTILNSRTGLTRNYR